MISDSRANFKMRFNDRMNRIELIIKLNDLHLEVQQLKDYILEYELLGDEIKPLHSHDDRLSIL